MAGSRIKHKQVISASRRTDIPAFYMDWFMDSLNRGYFEVENPYTRSISQVAVHPDNTHTLVFWSKNFGPFLRGNYGEKLLKKGYHLFFNFTLNSTDAILEPHVPVLYERLSQLRTLAQRFGPRAITWRFDPICHYRGNESPEKNNLSDFKTIALEASACGIKRCISSFVDLYSKVLSRTSPAIPGFSLIDVPMQRRVDLIVSMEQHLSPLGIRLSLCCEKELLDQLPPQCNVGPAACIPNDELIELYGPGISLAKDGGQRKAQGCGCSKSKDIGSYRFQPCYHDCLFCYANPKSPGDRQA